MVERALILPPLRRTAADAFHFAAIAHQGQTDKAGRPYVEHLGRVVLRTRNLARDCPFWSDWERDEAAQVAWLHDTVEDERCQAFDLRDEGFSDPVILAVRMLTKGFHGLLDPSGKMPYLGWIELITRKADLPAILVKLADVEDNSDSERLALLPEETRERLLRKYEPAREILKAAARAKGWQG